MFILSSQNLNNSTNSTTLNFNSSDEAREFVKVNYKFIDTSDQFYKNYTLAELYEIVDGEKLHVEDYLGRGTKDCENKILVWSRDRYNMWKNDFEWRQKEVIELTEH